MVELTEQMVETLKQAAKNMTGAKRWHKISVIWLSRNLKRIQNSRVFSSTRG